MDGIPGCLGPLRIPPSVLSRFLIAKFGMVGYYKIAGLRRGIVFGAGSSAGTSACSRSGRSSSLAYLNQTISLSRIVRHSLQEF